MKKQTIKRILIPMDFSETGQLALEHAAFMASLFKADLYLLHVMELFEYPYTLYDPLLAVPSEDDKFQKYIDSAMSEEAQKIRTQYGLNVIPIIKRGRVVAELAEVAKENEIDLIVMGTHGAKGFEEFFLGSNAHRTVTISPCPVITIQTHAQKTGFTNIVVPIDNTLHSRQKIDHVIELASCYGAFVHLLGLMKEEDNEKKFMIKIESVEKLLKKCRIGYESKIIRGVNLAVEAMKFSDEVKADLIIIMTEHESNLNGIFLGGFAKQIINHSKIPVMSIRPIEGPYESLPVGSNPYS